MGDFTSIKNIDNKLYTTKAGKYSPSRLNIVIGIVLLIIWTILLLIHSFFIIFNYAFIQNWVLKIIFILLLLFTAIIFFTAAKNKWAKSSTLSEKNE